MEEDNMEEDRLLQTVSPASSCLSVKSDHSMDRPNGDPRVQCGGTSPTSTVVSQNSIRSIDRPITFRDRTTSPYSSVNQERMLSPCLSMKSDRSMYSPINFGKDASGKQERVLSPCLSMKSDRSMYSPINFGKEASGKQERVWSPCLSMKSDWSMDRPINFGKDARGNQERMLSPCLSMKSDWSMDRPIKFGKDASGKQERVLSPCLSMKSDRSMDRHINFGKDASVKQERVLSPCLSMKSDRSMDRPINFGKDASELTASLLTEDHFRCSMCTEVLEKPVSIPCGHSYCRQCIETYWNQPDQTGECDCPQCRKRFRTRPDLLTNSASEKVIGKLHQAGFKVPALPSHCYAGPGDVACDLCTEKQLKAVKSCLTCAASYCESHVRHHYTVAALQRHTLVEVTGHLDQKLCQLHHRPLEVFCKTDQVSVCLLCVLQDHRSHDVIKNERDAEEENGQYQEDQIASRLEARLQREIKVLLHNTEELVSDNSEQNVKNTELNNPAKHFCRGLTEVWSIDLSERKASLLLEVLKLQPEKKPVELKGWSDEESEVRSFLQCLPYISQLSFPPPQDQRRSPEERTKREKIFLLNLCLQAALHERGTIQTTVEKLLSLSEVYHSQKWDFLLDLYSHVKDYETQTGRSVLPALQPVYQSASPAVWSIDLSERKASILLEVLKFQPVKKPVELKGWSDEESEVRSFLQCLPFISQLRLNVGMAVKLSRLVRRTGRGATPLTVPELSLVLKSNQPPERVLSRALSSVASLLRLWRVQCLDLTDFWIQGHSLITLLCHQGPLSLRLNSDTLQQLTVVVYEAQDKDLTQWFLEKVGGDLTSCRLDLEVLLSLLQHSTHNITVDLRKNRLLEKNISDLLPFLGRVIFKRSSSSFVKSTIRQIYDSRASDCVSSLLRSSDHWINLNSRELDRVDCTALCFTLQHCHQVKVNLLWTSIPPGEIESILPLLDRVSQLSVDRRILLSFLQCCAASQIQQGAPPPPPPTAVWLLRSLHYRLDFSCSSSVDLSAQDQEEALCLTTDHCRAITSVLKQNQHSTQLVQNQVQIILKDCEVEDRALRELLPILHIVKLSPSKALLRQLLDVVGEGIEEGVLRHAESLCRALDGELNLSETRLDQKACGSLALVLEHSEGMSELDLSHCQLTDHHLQTLITHLHNVQVLDLSHNDITDALTDRILQLVSTNTSIHTVRLFNNRIQDRRPFLTDKRFEIW